MLITKVISPGKNVFALDFQAKEIAINYCTVLRNPKLIDICYLYCKNIDRQSVECKNILSILYLPESGPVGCMRQYFEVNSSTIDLEFLPKNSRVQIIVQFVLTKD